MSNARPLRGHNRLTLIRQLAQGDATHDELADQYGVTRPAISLFATRNADNIAALRTDTANELAGLWIASKAARVAEYERDVDDINEALPGVDPADRTRLYGSKHRALRGAAEELGQLAPTRIDVDHQVRYQVVGVDPEALR